MRRLRPGEKARIKPRFAKELLRTCDTPSHGVDLRTGTEDFELFCKVNGEVRRFSLEDISGEEIHIIDGREQTIEYKPEGMPEFRPQHQRRRRPRRY